MDPELASRKRVGTTVREKWLLEQLIGVGGMASVFVGRHKIGRREAIKILHPDMAAHDEIRARFEQEARAVNSLRHPGAVEIRDIDVTEDGAPFLVMELLEGESLAERSRRDPPLSLAEILRFAAETLDVLQAAHASGIIHRDIKPDNLFLTRAGTIKVLDFGIARVRSAGGRANPTQVGVMLGTMAYMPPEQARGLEIDPRADLYAVGATVYRLLSGRIVHDAKTEGELVLKAMSEPVPPLRSVAPDVPAEVCAVVDRALAFDRANRYPDARTMKLDVEAALRGEPPPFLSSAGPLPEDAPSSAMFALRPSFFGDAPSSSVADGASSIASARSLRPESRSGVAPSPEPPRAASLARPQNAQTRAEPAAGVVEPRAPVSSPTVPSAARVVVQPPVAPSARAPLPVPPNATLASQPAPTTYAAPAVSSQQASAKPTARPHRTYAVAAAGALVVLLAIAVAIAFILSTCTGGAGGADETGFEVPAAEPSPLSNSQTDNSPGGSNDPPPATEPRPSSKSKTDKGKARDRDRDRDRDRGRERDRQRK